MKRRTTYGASNFEEIIRTNMYYIDKTMYIETLETVKYPVFLRPRRFGKTLFTETLRWYYDIKKANQFESLFNKLYIGKNPTPNHSTYYFLKLDFSGMGVWVEGDRNFVKKQFDAKLNTDFTHFLKYYKVELEIKDDYIHELEIKFKDNASGYLDKIISLVGTVEGKMYIAIDEYDSLTNALALIYKDMPEEDNEYLNVLRKGGFFRGFFETIKKGTTTSIAQVFITGILPITLADMTSGFNISSHITFKKRFANMLGITNNEFNQFIDRVYSDYKLDFNKKRLKEICKEYYDGYCFVDEAETVYNPMMLMYVIDNMIYEDQLPEIMADTNLRISYQQIEFLFGNNFGDRDNTIKKITCDKELERSTSLQVSFDMNSFRDGNYITEGLFYMGVLTNGKSYGQLTIPNLVTYEFVLNYFNRISNFKISGNALTGIIHKYISNGNVELFIQNFFHEVIQTFPGDFFKNVNESYYHGLLFYILWNGLLKSRYEVFPEFQVTTGKVDIMVRSLPNARVHHKLNDLFEIKQVAKSASEPEFKSKLKKAVDEIKNYRQGAYKNWRGIAICFRGNKDFRTEIVL